MAEVASAFVSLMPSAKGFGASTERQIAPQMNSVAKRTGARFGKVFAYASMSPLKAIGAAAIGLFAVQKVKQFFQGAIGEAREAQKVSAITAQVIKSTGGAANISAQQVGRLSTSISNMTGIDDEAIQTGANLLLTFKNLRNETGKGNDVFNQATSIITDMSVALGTDVKGSAIQVGKALNDPIKGISALTRVGVTFTEQQKKQIETLVSSGKTLDAQKIILGELRSEFGGTAAAAATAGDRFKVAYANFQESVGTALLPLLDQLLIKGIKVISFLQNDVPRAFAQAQAAMAPVVEVVRSFVENHLPAFKTALAALAGAGISSLVSLIGGGLFTAISVLVGALVSPIALIGALAGAFLYAYRTSEQFRVQVNAFAAWSQATLVPALMQIGATIRSDVLPALTAFADWLFTKAYPAAINFWKGVGQKLQPALVALGQTVRADLLPALTALVAELRQHQPAIQQATQLVIRFESAYGKLSSSMLGKVLPPLIKVTGFLVGSHLSAVASVIDIVFDWISALAKVGGALSKAASKVVEFTSVVRGQVIVMYGIGKDLVLGLINGIRSMAGTLVSAAKSVVQSAINAAKGLLKIGSPSKVFHQIGEWTIEGFANGIDSASPKLLKSMQSALEKTLDQLDAFGDRVSSRLDSIKSAFSSLSGSVASAFSTDLFQSANLDSFLNGAVSQHGTLSRMLAAFKKLKKWGIPPQFLSQLFASGNSALIMELASSRGDAILASTLFEAGQSLSTQLGNQVARNQYGAQIDRLDNKLERIEKHTQHLNHLAKDIGRELNNAVGHGQKKAG